MSFSRALSPPDQPSPDSLTSAMVGIGFGLAADGDYAANIEDTLFYASTEGVDNDDLRILSLLVTWFGIHHTWVNADRLTRIVSQVRSQRVRALWSALCSWQAKDRRFARLSCLHRGPRLDILSVGSDFQIRRFGEDSRFVNTVLRVPSNLLRDRSADVLLPTDLARRHHAYYFRLLIGPTYRADVWATLEREPTLSVAEIARRTYASFSTAWTVRRDFAHLAPLRSGLTTRCS